MSSELNLSAMILNRLAESMKAQIKEKGLLYTAIRLVAHEVDRNVDKLLSTHRILPNATIDEDIESLQRFGVSEDMTSMLESSYRDFFGSNLSDITDLSGKIARRKAYVLTLAASFIVLLSFKEQNRLHQRLASVPKLMVLALVLKGTDLEGVNPEMNPNHESIMQLVDRSGYFLCVAEDSMKNIQGDLNLELGEVDRQSEKQVLITVHFDHPIPIEQIKGFTTKLELMHYLNKGATGFRVDTIRTVAKISGLSSLGFIRT